MKTNLPNTVADWLEYCEKNHPSVIQLGLDRVRTVAERADLLSFPGKIITIAGTNGKGSTLTSLAKLFQHSGKRYGTYTSPHLLHFNERIRINGEVVSEQVLNEAFATIHGFCEGMALTFFEFTTLVAFYIFQRVSLDLLILEVGLGGRLDAVNIISPHLAIITSISQDHEEWLGHTLSDIAREKAGILRPGIPVVLSHEANYPVIIEKAQAYGSLLWQENPDASLALALPPHYLPPNSVALAMGAYTILENDKELGLKPLSEAVKNLEKVGMVGRFHRLMVDQKNCIFDVAHNPGGTKWLAERLEKKRSGKRKGVWSSLADKDHIKMIAPLCDKIDEWYVGGLSVPRASSLENLQKALHQHNIQAIRSFRSVQEAFLTAQQEATAEDEIVIFGSFHTVAEGYKIVDETIAQQDHGLYYG